MKKTFVFTITSAQRPMIGKLNMEAKAYHDAMQERFAIILPLWQYEVVNIDRNIFDIYRVEI